MDSSHIELLSLIRIRRFPAGVIGVMSIHNTLVYSVEKPWMDNAPNISCIPIGSYLCRMIDSPKFGKVYEVTNVPLRSHILIHPSNFASQLKGCIGLGLELAGGLHQNGVLQSQKAVHLLEDEMEGKDFMLRIEERLS